MKYRNYQEERSSAAKKLGLLTMREWAAKHEMPELLKLADESTLDGVRGYLRDKPARFLLNDDGTPFVYCAGPVLMALPGPVEISLGITGNNPISFSRAGAFYLCLDMTNSKPRVVFAEAC